VPKKVKKDRSKTTITGGLDELSNKDTLSFMKSEYKIATGAALNYSALKEELNKYIVETPRNPDIEDLSKISKCYAEAQSQLSRVHSIEIEAIDNNGRWERIVNALDGYIEECSSELLLSEELEELTIPKATAKVRVLLKKEYGALRKVKNKHAEAASFLKMVTTKKKDLASVLVTLKKQVEALSLDQALQR
jgi:hypothetical protein